MSTWAAAAAIVAVASGPRASAPSKPLPPPKRARLHLDLRTTEMFAHDSLRRYREQHGGDAIVSYGATRRLTLVEALGLRANRTIVAGVPMVASQGIVFSTSAYYQVFDRAQLSATIGQDLGGTPLSDGGANFTRFIRLDLTVRIF